MISHLMKPLARKSADERRQQAFLNRQMKHLYGWPVEMDDDTPRHLEGSPSWTEVIGQR